MASSDQPKRNVRDVTSAWESFRNLIHRGLPSSSQTVNNANHLASQRRNYS